MVEKNDLLVLAQNLSLKHKLQEKLTGGGLQRAISEMGSSKYKDRMETLRDADSAMRETAVLFKDYLKSAERAFKDNRYLDVAHWCSMINDGVKLMMKDAKSVVDLRDAEIAEYYTRHEDANPEHNYFSADDGLVSTAGLLDRLFGNSIEKLYWEKIRESKLAIQSLVSKAEKLVAVTYSSLDRMGTARAKGNIGSWIKDLQRIGKEQGEFQVSAKGIYDKHLKELANIVKANKPAPVQDQPAPPQNAPKATSDMTHEEYMKHLDDNTEPSNEPFELKNKKEDKFEPGRPALNDPRSVQKKNQKEIDQLQDLLSGNVKLPETKVQDKVEEPKNVAPIIPEPPKVVEAPIAPENKVEAPKAEVPKAVQAPIAKPIEAPKPISAPVVAPIVPQKVQPVVPQAPTQTTVNEAPKRGRGRPKSPARLERERLEREGLNSPSVSAPQTVSPAVQESNVDSNPFSASPAVVPSVSAPVAPKESPVHVDIKGKEPTEPDESTEKRDKVFGDIDKKVTLVMIPKIKPDNLAEIKEKLQKQLGHPIRFVNKSDGAAIAKELKDQKYDVDAMIFDDAVKEINQPKANPLELLNDPEFLASLPQLSNGFYDKGRIIDDNGATLNGRKVDEGKSKYPEFNNMDKDTRKAVIDKLNKLDEENAKNPNFVKNKEKKVDEVPTATPSSTSKEPELEHYLENLNKSVSAPKLDESKAPSKEKELEKEIANIPGPSKTEDELEQEKFIHSGLIEKILGKSMKDVSDSDVFQLLNNREYLDSLPKDREGKFDLNLISQFPEVKMLKTPEFDSSKMYFTALKAYDSGKTKLPAKAKAASEVDQILVKVAHKKFFVELEKVAKTQNKGLMAALMCRYSEEIDNIDPVMSMKLLAQAERLLD